MKRSRIPAAVALVGALAAAFMPSPRVSMNAQNSGHLRPLRPIGPLADDRVDPERVEYPENIVNLQTPGDGLRLLVRDPEQPTFTR